ncbi:hypothetical protein BGZ61DRAFT_374138 [Ilyonectria robusta]|uniref:uncharacterized protein n=1 Tax=Ilyonectria robusta TaxID=1079257 RepID=UPI001E8E2624|nr:uncharacterized protein BGZ61DRAFT_374138 [Ilyonectria robusta]KAH8653299.1 hypothetical protein BGZ61DRAFT_374138 [Ilyonectria robusta]
MALPPDQPTHPYGDHDEGFFDGGPLGGGGPTTASRSIQFDPPWPELPKIAVGFSWIDIGTNTNPRIEVVAKDIKKGRFTVTMGTWLDTTVFGSISTWLEVPSNKPRDWQVGTWSTSDPDQPTRIDFDTSFDHAPKVLVWISHLDQSNDHPTRLNCFADGIDPNGFTIHAKTSLDSVTFGSTVNWIAYRQDMKVESGLVNLGSGTIDFPPRKFNKPPRVFMALSLVDVSDDQGAVRLRCLADNVSQAGFRYILETWQGTTVFAAQAQWIAVL